VTLRTYDGELLTIPDNVFGLVHATMGTTNEDTIAYVHFGGDVMIPDDCQGDLRPGGEWLDRDGRPCGRWVEATRGGRCVIMDGRPVLAPWA
jgi:hypothetical protein